MRKVPQKFHEAGGDESEDETDGRSPISIVASPRVRHECCISHEASIDPRCHGLGGALPRKLPPNAKGESFDACDPGTIRKFGERIELVTQDAPQAFISAWLQIIAGLGAAPVRQRRGRSTFAEHIDLEFPEGSDGWSMLAAFEARVCAMIPGIAVDKLRDPIRRRGGTIYDFAKALKTIGRMDKGDLPLKLTYPCERKLFIPFGAMFNAFGGPHENNRHAKEASRRVSVVRLPSGVAIAEPQKMSREDEFSDLKAVLDELDQQVPLGTALKEHPTVLDCGPTSSDEECGADTSKVGSSHAKDPVCSDIRRDPSSAEMGDLEDAFVYAYRPSSPGRHFSRYYVLAPYFTVSNVREWVARTLRTVPGDVIFLNNNKEGQPISDADFISDVEDNPRDKTHDDEDEGGKKTVILKFRRIPLRLGLPDATPENEDKNDATSQKGNSGRRDGRPSSERDENAAPVEAQSEENLENWGSITLPAFLGKAANKLKFWPLPFNRWRVTGEDAKGRRTTFVLSADTLDAGLLF